MADDFKLVTDGALTQRIHSEEKMFGGRAKYHVYHTTKGGKKRFDVSVADTPHEAAAYIRKCYQYRVTVLTVVQCDQTVSIKGDNAS